MLVCGFKVIATVQCLREHMYNAGIFLSSNYVSASRLQPAVYVCGPTRAQVRAPCLMDRHGQGSEFTRNIMLTSASEEARTSWEYAGVGRPKVTHRCRASVNCQWLANRCYIQVTVISLQTGPKRHKCIYL